VAGEAGRSSPSRIVGCWPAAERLDHLHIHLEYPPKLWVSVLVTAFKGHDKSDASQDPGETSPLAVVMVFCGRRRISSGGATFHQAVWGATEPARFPPRAKGRGFRALKIW
jgi:hypothetical protein